MICFVKLAWAVSPGGSTPLTQLFCFEVVFEKREGCTKPHLQGLNCNGLYFFQQKSKGGEPRAGAVATPFQLFLFFCSVIFSMWPFSSCFLSRGHKTAAPAIGSHSHSKYEEKTAGREGAYITLGIRWSQLVSALCRRLKDEGDLNRSYSERFQQPRSRGLLGIAWSPFGSCVGALTPWASEWHLEMGHLHHMAPHSSILAWKIPRTEEPGRL